MEKLTLVFKILKAEYNESHYTLYSIQYEGFNSLTENSSVGQLTKNCSTPNFTRFLTVKCLMCLNVKL